MLIAFIASGSEEIGIIASLAGIHTSMLEVVCKEPYTALGYTLFVLLNEERQITLIAPTGR